MLFFNLKSMLSKRALQRGNMMLMLFGAVAVTGTLGAAYMTMVNGPGRGLQEVARQNKEDNAMMVAVRLVASGNAAQQDCDADGVVEPKPFMPANGKPAPVGGGLLPADAGSSRYDSRDMEFGYCVWDHGAKTRSDNVPECGGSSANRLEGGDVKTEYVLAIISSGRDKVFQTTCNAFVDANSDKVADAVLINTPAGSDDIVKPMTMAVLLSDSKAQLPTLPDSACATGSEGMTRYEAGVMQVCTPAGWKEVGATVVATATYTPVVNATLNTVYTTTTGIVFTGFFGAHKISVDNGATILVNDVVRGANTTVEAGQTVKLRATSSVSPEITSTYTLTVGALKRTWTVTTRNKTPATLTITPSPYTTANVTGPGGLTYGSGIKFTVSNSGEANTAALSNAALSNLTNFEFYSNTGAGFYADNCTSRTLGPVTPSCEISIRPKATTGGPISSNLTVTAGGLSSVVVVSGTASGWGCTLDGETVNEGSSGTFYMSTSAASCPGLSRQCVSGNFNGNASYQYSDCHTWQTSGWSACSLSCGGGTQTQTVNCRKIDAAQNVADSFCSGAGAKPATSQSCNTQACGPSCSLITEYRGFGRNGTCGGSLVASTTVSTYAQNNYNDQLCDAWCNGRGATVKCCELNQPTGACRATTGSRASSGNTSMYASGC